jgi:hypothetical protein
MNRLLLFVRRIGDEYRRQAIEAQDAVWSRIRDRLMTGSGL